MINDLGNVRLGHSLFEVCFQSEGCVDKLTSQTKQSKTIRISFGQMPVGEGGSEHLG